MGSTMSTSDVLSDGTMAKEYVDQQIAEHKVLVFSKTWCGFCKMAKNALGEINAKPTVIELDKTDDGPAIQKYLSQLTGENTVPRVFINGKCIGGGSETKALQKSGKLQKLINGEPC